MTAGTTKRRVSRAAWMTAANAAITIPMTAVAISIAIAMAAAAVVMPFSAFVSSGTTKTMDTPDWVDIDPTALVARLVINDVCRRWSRSTGQRRSEHPSIEEGGRGRSGRC